MKVCKEHDVLGDEMLSSPDEDYQSHINYLHQICWQKQGKQPIIVWSCARPQIEPTLKAK